MRKYLHLFFALPFLFFFLSCTKQTDHTEGERVLVFAAASLSQVLEEIRRAFEQQYSGRVRFNLASSGTLARQISQGAPADVFISANVAWLQYLDSLNTLRDNHWDTLARNRLVLIAPSVRSTPVVSGEQKPDILETLGGKRLSMGDPAHVPAGIYARQALEHLGVYTSLQDQLLPAKDVRSALMVVELGEAPLGMVYQTDAQQSQKVKVLYKFPENVHKPIIYGATLLKDSPASRQFLAYLSSPEARAIWKRYGFVNE